MPTRLFTALDNRMAAQRYADQLRTRLTRPTRTATPLRYDLSTGLYECQSNTGGRVMVKAPLGLTLGVAVPIADAGGGLYGAV